MQTLQLFIGQLFSLLSNQTSGDQFYCVLVFRNHYWNALFSATKIDELHVIYIYKDTQNITTKF